MKQNIAADGVESPSQVESANTNLQGTPHGDLLPQSTATTPGVQPDDLMSEAGRKILRFYFRKMLDAEPIAREGSDPEGVHDMRVATRRMRSVLQLFAPYFAEARIKPFRRDLRRIADSLGMVRDLDVAHGKTHKYLDKQESDKKGLTGLLKEWEGQAKDARINLNNLLDSHKYASFLTDYSLFVTTLNDGTFQPDADDMPFANLVKQVVPRMVYQKFEAVRAYEPILANASLDMLHQLRIEAKRLRYALESFEEVLGSEARSVITATKALQDHLGDLQDARVAISKMHDYLRRSKETVSQESTLHYLTEREAEKSALFEAAREQWDTFISPENRRALALAVSVL